MKSTKIPQIMLISLILLLGIYVGLCQLFSNWFLPTQLEVEIEKKLSGKVSVENCSTDLFTYFGAEKLLVTRDGQEILQLNQFVLLPDYNLPYLFLSAASERRFQLNLGQVDCDFGGFLAAVTDSKQSHSLDWLLYPGHITINRLQITHLNIPKFMRPIGCNSLNWKGDGQRFILSFQGQFGETYPLIGHCKMQGDASEIFGKIGVLSTLLPLDFFDKKVALRGMVSADLDFSFSPLLLLVQGIKTIKMTGILRWWDGKFESKDQEYPMKIPDNTGEIRLHSLEKMEISSSGKGFSLNAQFAHQFSFDKPATFEATLTSDEKHISGKLLAINQKNQLDLRHFSLEQDQQKLMVKGNWNLLDNQFALSVKVSEFLLTPWRFFLKKYYPDFSEGIVQRADLKIHRTVEGTVLPSGMLKLKNLVWAGQKISTIDTNFSLTTDSIQLEKTFISLPGGEKCEVSGHFSHTPPFSAKLQIRNFVINDNLLVKLGIKVKGKAIFSGSLTLENQAIILSGKIQNSNLKFQNILLFTEADVELTASLLTSSKVQLEKLQLRPTHEEIQIERQSNGQIKVTAKVAGERLKILLATTSLSFREITADSLRVLGVFDSTFSPIHGTVNFGEIKLVSGGLPLKIEPAELNFRKDKISCKELPFYLAGSKIPMQFEYGLQSGVLTGRMSSEKFDISRLINRLTPGIRISGAASSMDLTARVNLKDKIPVPELTGFVKLFVEKIAFPWFEESVNGLHIDLTARGKELEIVSGGFIIRESPWKFSGNWNFSQGIPGKFNMAVVSKNANWKMPGLLETKGDVDLRLTGTPFLPKIVGNVEVHEGVLHLPEGFESNSSLTTIPLDLDINLNIPRKFWVRNEFLNSELQGKLTVKSQNGKAGLVGNLSVVRGTFSVNGQDFKILDGRLTFPATDKIFPTLDVQAEARVKDYLIKVDTAGSLDHLAINFSSSPILRRDEIMSLLTTGNINTGLTTEDTGRMSGQLLLNYQKTQMFGGLRKSIQKSLNLDALSFDADVMPDTKNRSSNLTVGKYLSDKLYMTYSLKKSEETDKTQRYEFDYRLDKKVNFTLENETLKGTTFGIKVRRKF